MQITPINSPNFTMALKYQGNRTYIRNELNKLSKEELLHLKEIKNEFKDYKYIDIIGQLYNYPEDTHSYLKYFLGIKKGIGHELFDKFDLKFLPIKEDIYDAGIDAIVKAARIMEKHIEENKFLIDELIEKCCGTAKK